MPVGEGDDADAEFRDGHEPSSNPQDCTQAMYPSLCKKRK